MGDDGGSGGVSGTEGELGKDWKDGKSNGMLFSGILTVGVSFICESIELLGSSMLTGMPTLDSVFELAAIRLPRPGISNAMGFGVVVTAVGEIEFKAF